MTPAVKPASGRLQFLKAVERSGNAILAQVAVVLPALALVLLSAPVGVVLGYLVVVAAVLAAVAVAQRRRRRRHDRSSMLQQDRGDR